jgi:hypothetical protein
MSQAKADNDERCLIGLENFKMNVWWRTLSFAVLLGAVGLARADLVPVGSLGTVNPSAHVSFANPNVTVGTMASAGGVNYNFLDQYNFTLAADADVASIVATINFSAGSGGPVLFGITNLQVNLRAVPASGPLGPPLVSWLTVTSPAAGLNQEIALVPASVLTAGNYALQVRGVLTTPGSYSGSLIAAVPTVVPLPAALPLLMLGFGAIAAAGVRRGKPVSIQIT